MLHWRLLYATSITANTKPQQHAQHKPACTALTLHTQFKRARCICVAATDATTLTQGGSMHSRGVRVKGSSLTLQGQSTASVAAR